MASRTLFVCTGNTCRSPMAAALFAALCARHGLGHIEVGSAGLAALPGSAASANMQAVAAELGVPLAGHRARSVSPEDFAAHDLLVCLSAGHLHALAGAVPPERLRLLGGGIADPYGASLAEYRACAAQINRALGPLLGELKADFSTLKPGCAIVPAQEAHAEAIAALEALVFHPALSHAEVLRKLNEVPTAHWNAALWNGELAGFSGVDEYRGEAFIDDVAVFPHLQRRGVGNALLARAETEAVLRGAVKIHLEVREGNAAARALYRARGYEEVGLRKGYYKRPQEDAVLMTMNVE